MSVLMTTRLRGLPLSETDFDDLYDLTRDERVLAAFGAEPGTAAEDARDAQEFLDRKLALDLAFIEEEEQGVERPFLMTTDHDDDPLAEALWYAIGLAFHGDVRDPADSAVVIGTDSDVWGAEIRAWLADPDELRRYVVDDLPM